MRVLLDCGHTLSGADTGAQGNGRTEQQCTREIGYRVKSKLESLGHSVIVCNCDSASTLGESLAYRVNKANSNGGDVYISIHLNAGGGLGTEVFTYGGKEITEARNILNNIVALGFNNRGIKDGSGLYVLRHTNMKSMLIECCFIDTSDMNKYNAENFANAIVKGLTGKTVNGGNSSNSNTSSNSNYNSNNGGSYYNVKEVQQMLIKIGYPCGNSGADGVWGNGTVTAVQSFQKDCNLKVDGWVGNDTYNKIKFEYNKKIGNVPKPSVPVNNPPQVKNLYRVRSTWQDIKSQKGAYSVLQNAIDECKKYNNYKVFDEKGNVVYPKIEENKQEFVKTSIMGKSILTKEQMAQYVLKNNSNPKISVDIIELADIYLQEGDIEGIRGDIAFCQAIKETGFFKFGGDMLPEQNNYCGLGTTGDGVKGAYFKTPKDGVKAQIQHLQAYASKENLKSECIDPRFNLIEKGIASNWEDLNGKWAVPGIGYGQEILQIYEKIKLEQVEKKEDKPTNNEKSNDKDSLISTVLKLLIELLKKILKK